MYTIDSAEVFKQAYPVYIHSFGIYITGACKGVTLDPLGDTPRPQKQEQKRCKNMQLRAKTESKSKSKSQGNSENQHTKK